MDLNTEKIRALDNLETTKTVFTKSTNIKLTYIALLLIIFNAVLIFLDHPPKDHDQKMSETVYHSGLVVGLILVYVVISLSVSTILSFILYRGINFR